MLFGNSLFSHSWATNRHYDLESWWTWEQLQFRVGSTLLKTTNLQIRVLATGRSLSTYEGENARMHRITCLLNLCKCLANDSEIQLSLRSANNKKFKDNSLPHNEEIWYIEEILPKFSRISTLKKYTFKVYFWFIWLQSIWFSWQNILIFRYYAQIIPSSKHIYSG